MSTSLKLLIPIASGNLKLEDIDPKNGFVDAYTRDINKPYLDNHIFLMFKFGTNSHKKWFRHDRMKNDVNRYNTFTYQIKGELYTVYCFCIDNRLMKSMIKEYPQLTKSEKIRIGTFWNGTDENVSNFIFTNVQTKPLKFDYNTIPEQDYVE